MNQETSIMEGEEWNWGEVRKTKEKKRGRKQAGGGNREREDKGNRCRPGEVVA